MPRAQQGGFIPCFARQRDFRGKCLVEANDHRRPHDDRRINKPLNIGRLWPKTGVFPRSTRYPRDIYRPSLEWIHPKDIQWTSIGRFCCLGREVGGYFSCEKPVNDQSEYRTLIWWAGQVLVSQHVCHAQSQGWERETRSKVGIDKTRPIEGRSCGQVAAPCRSQGASPLLRSIPEILSNNLRSNVPVPGELVWRAT